MDTWVSPVPPSAAPAAREHERPLPGGFDARSAARAIAEPSVRVLAGSAARGDVEATDPSTTFRVGALLDSRYQILRFVGRGGMGEVYEAHDQLMDRVVALKTILRNVADRSRAARRFKAEVRNAQRVAHPNVCRIHDLHEHHDGVSDAPLPFFTMELIDGERLAQRLLGGALPLEDARRIALQLLEGLAAAHARGVLHLDFKSDNVLLRRGAGEPEAAIMDFGLSRVHGDSGGLLTSDRRQVAGTLPYMSIEQLECRDSLGPATDVYAFGVVLYEMLTRAMPFDGESLGTLLMKQLNERPEPPSRRVPGLSPAIDRFVLRCLDREPRERFSDAGAALAALRAIGQWARPSPALDRWRLFWPAAALCVAGAVLLSRRSTEPPGPATGELAQVTSLGAPAADTSGEPAQDMPVVAATALTEAAPWVAPAPATRADPASSALAEGALTTNAAPAGAARPSVAAAGLTDAATTSAAVRSPSPPAPRAAGGERPLGNTAASTSPSPEGAPSTSGPTTPSTAAMAAMAPEPATNPAARDAPSWTPTRVPKRLSTIGLVRPLGAARAAAPAGLDVVPPAPASETQNRPR